jgi:hypothetical protein
MMCGVDGVNDCVRAGGLAVMLDSRLEWSECESETVYECVCVGELAV